ncbi:FtsX-like permease family protein [Frankia sp. QA3]|uniref:FtsX-like permease family protein n=1 Tax=Frankia sp. QA3 TaxID=710111 RepID=UPI000269BAC9|nr:FtsX-like permease family protein [Frankia sp. QA3]EIV91009.1 ABC-type transport system, involved in lipoprotein release, permease component [Frankia sp. QA3]
MTKLGFPAGRAALRVARRDALRAKGRTLLVAVMIGLPVLLVSGVDVITRSADDGPSEHLWRKLGAHPELQARFDGWHFGLPMAQSPDAETTGPVDPDAGWPAHLPDVEQARADLAAALPPGDRLVTVHDAYDARFRIDDSGARGGSRFVRANLRQADWTDPSLAGLVDITSGRLPAKEGEVTVTASFARHFGVRVGDTMRFELPDRAAANSTAPTDTTAPAGAAPPAAAPPAGAAPPAATSADPPTGGEGRVRVMDVVGVARLNEDRNIRTVLGMPSLLPADGTLSFGGDTLYAAGPNPVTWNDVLRLNRLGAVVVSRAVFADPPPASDVPEVPGSSGASAALDVAVAATVVGLVLLEVALLAGPAFAVGARRNIRHLALVSASGGNRRQIGNIVLAGGLVVGFGASVVGAGLGAGVGVAALPVLEHYEQADFAHTDVRLLDLALIVLVGTLTAVAAAVVPAWQASKVDVVAALAGRRGPLATPRRVPVLGVVAVAVGAGLAALGAATVEPLPVLAGTAVVTLGLIATAGSVVGLVARAARRLPVAARMALRDAARQRGRTAPAVGAVVAAVTGSVAISLYVAALDNHDQLTYRPSAAPGGVVLDLTRWGPNGPEQPHPAAPAEALLRENLPIDRVARINVIGDPGGSSSSAYPDPRSDIACDAPYDDAPYGNVPGLASSKAPVDERCGERGLVLVHNGVVVGDGSALDVASNGGYPDVRAVVAAGVAAVTNPRYLQANGKVVVKVSPPYDPGQSGAESSERTLVLPARLVERTGGTPIDMVVVPPALVLARGYSVIPGAVVASTTRVPTASEAQRADSALADAGIDNGLVVERGYQSAYGIGLLALAVAAAVITLGATGIAVGLAATDGRADLATLAAVGASPGVRRRLAASQAAVIAGTGAVMGVVAGAVPGLALIWMQRHGSGTFDPSWEFVPPWLSLTSIVVLVPLVAVACGWLFTRSRLPIVRRVTL